MSLSKQLTRALGVAALAAAVVGLAVPADASPVPPSASTAVLGTWVNTNANTRSVKQVIITPNRIGNVNVDAFGACVPTLCEWGAVPAIVYGPNVSAKTGATFQTNQRFLASGKEWSRTTLLGNVARTASGGLLLSLRELTVFEDGSGRKNYTVTETFVRSDGGKVSRLGNPVASYVRGNPPLLVSAALGNWKNTSLTGALVSIKITGTTASPVVEAFGRCSPTPCDWGKVRAIAYGPSISAPTGNTALAPYRFSFKNTQLVITYSRALKTERLTVGEYNEFTDGSGRSNYAITETFVRA
jgi:hypothetical protein